jgi:hypothetical protein
VKEEKWAKADAAPSALSRSHTAFTPTKAMNRNDCVDLFPSGMQALYSTRPQSDGLVRDSVSVSTAQTQRSVSTVSD